MTGRVKLTLTFTGYWISGTGASLAREVNVVTHRDRDSLPAMPMSQVKGQLRETAQRLAASGKSAWSQALVDELFGAAPPENDMDPPRGAMLGFRGEARLPDDLRPWLALAGQKSVREQLFVRHSATAIGDAGAALDHSLRSVEAVIPVTLEGYIDWVGADPPRAGWVKALDLACAATLAFGKLKSDGYGRAIAQVKPA
jgi:hypothetical protein